MTHTIRLLVQALALSAAGAAFAQDKAPAKVDFAKEIWPIFEKSCIECHATAKAGADGKLKKPKGGVVLDSKDGITTSKKGKLVVAKKPDDSLIVQAITLPADDEDRMPPAKKGDPLSQEQQELVKRWIAEGASFGSWTGKAKDDGKGGKDGSKEKGGAKGDGGAKTEGGKSEGKEDPLAALGAGLAALDPAALADKGPFAIASVGDGSALLRVSCFGHEDEVDDAAVAKSLGEIAENIAVLDLGRTRAGDGACAVIAKMKRLVRLDLRETAVGDAGVKQIAACTELRSLNLYGTKVADAGIQALAPLAKLEQIYLWQTDASVAAIARLKQSLPSVRVVFAAELPDPMPEGQGGGRRRRGGK